MVRRHDTRRPDTRHSANRGLGLGAELAAAITGFALFGLWIDHTYETSPWGVLVCVTLGLVGGFYNFLRSARRLLKSPVAPGPHRARGDKSTGSDRRNQTAGDDETPDSDGPAHRRDAADSSD